ncbi:MAG: hypothetical protein K2Q24_07340 [Chitinophagaceae bacterium]|jgi:pectinesterase|nr:hypothetical protein [Chitinophagaceae bacterium]
MRKKLTIIKSFILVLLISFSANSQTKLIVAQDGSGNYTTVQEAINSLSDSSAVIRSIYIKKGIYKEKIFIKKNNLVLEGEDRTTTVITAAIARDEWRCDHIDDWGVATMNVGANDITLKNLTVSNSYGFDFLQDRVVDCAADTVTKKKTITKGGHQMALRTMGCTRLKAINCYFKAYAGDTVSPWEVENGMWYFKDCVMEGGVDFYCPRGWAFAENCEFIANTGSAAIWHDGSKHEDSKTVLLNCRFKGYDGFLLGRYHRDAQFYLINCLFADNMKDAPIYRVATSNTIQWGERIYYYNCHRKAGDYTWFKNNISKELVQKINAQWVFGERWKP